ELDKIEAIDKEDEYLVVDIEQLDILKEPKDQTIDFESVDFHGTFLELTIPYHMQENELDFTGVSFGQILDGNGKVVQSNASSSTWKEPEKHMVLGYQLNQKPSE